ncbi:MAG: TonB-dependent receptor plug domain-containing protein, partial [Sphingobium sp.]
MKIGGSSERRLFRYAFCGALLTTIALGGIAAPAAYAQSASASQRDFSIPAQSLAQALAAFGRQSGIDVTASPPLVEGKTSSAVAGKISPAEALSRLLTGTGLTFRFISATGVTLERAPESADGSIQLGPVRVEGTGNDGVGSPVYDGEATATAPVRGYIAVRSASGTRSDTPIIETPQTVNIVGRQQMEDQGALTVGDALRYTPGIVTGLAGGQADRHDSYFVRGEGGFSAAAQYASMLDGMRWRFTDRTTVQFDPWMLERVEVVKGPSSTLFG